MTFAVIPHSPSLTPQREETGATASIGQTQAGSLLRPSNVLDARDASKTGKIGRKVLEREEDVGVLEVLMRQQQIDLLELRA
jgi:methionine synthase II (cobalamin-independent)